MSDIVKVQDVLDKKISLSQARQMIVMHKGEAYVFFDQGCTRHVFVNKEKTKVIKILQSELGIDYNEEEEDIWKKAGPDIKAEMVPTKLEGGLIEQEYVTPVKFGGLKMNLQQRMFAASCRNEVGWTKDGRLLCYDLDEYRKY